MGVRCSNASFEKNLFLFVRASSANSKFRLFFSGFEARCSWWCWRAVQRLFLLLKSSGRVYYECYYYPKGVGKEKGTGRGRYREKRPHGRETLTPSSGVTILNSKVNEWWVNGKCCTFSFGDVQILENLWNDIWVIRASNGASHCNCFLSASYFEWIGWFELF